jgi:hypothetical protein
VVTKSLGNFASTNCEVGSSLVCCPHVAGSSPGPRCGLRCPQRTNERAKAKSRRFFGRSLKTPPPRHVIHTAIRSSGTAQHSKHQDPEKLRDARCSRWGHLLLPAARAASNSNFLDLTLERSRARLGPRQEGIRRTTCKKVCWCSVVIGLHRKLALQLAWLRFIAPPNREIALNSPVSPIDQVALAHMGPSFILYQDLLSTSLLPSPSLLPPSLSIHLSPSTSTSSEHGTHCCSTIDLPCTLPYLFLLRLQIVLAPPVSPNPH